MPGKIQHLEPRIGPRGYRAPLIHSERIRQLKSFARETEKLIARMEKNGNISKNQIIMEKQLLNNIRITLQDLRKKAIKSEFFCYDYSPIL